MLPSENQLCEEYGVSVTTARRALLELVKEGVARGEGLTLVQGLGCDFPGMVHPHEARRFQTLGFLKAVFNPQRLIGDIDRFGGYQLGWAELCGPDSSLGSAKKQQERD